MKNMIKKLTPIFIFLITISFSSCDELSTKETVLTASELEGMNFTFIRTIIKETCFEHEAREYKIEDSDDYQNFFIQLYIEDGLIKADEVTLRSKVDGNIKEELDEDVSEIIFGTGNTSIPLSHFTFTKGFLDAITAKSTSQAACELELFPI